MAASPREPLKYTTTTAESRNREDKATVMEVHVAPELESENQFSK